MRKCQVPNLDQPGKWNELMAEIQERLVLAHGGDPVHDELPQKVYFILAAGMKWMMFVWDPDNTQAPLYIRSEHQEDH